VRDSAGEGFDHNFENPLLSSEFNGRGRGAGEGFDFFIMICIMMKYKLILVILLIFFSAGCATVLPEDDNTVRKIINGFEGEPVVPRNANRLYVLPPVNSTGRDEMAPLLLYKVREYISLDGRLGVETDDKNGDLRLEIQITKFVIEPMKYDEIGRAVKKRMWVTADVRLFDIKRKKMIFFEADIQSFTLYSELLPPVSTESRAMDAVLDDLAKRITSKTVTGWYTDRMTIIEKRKL
jgi:hypothetical protein